MSGRRFPLIVLLAAGVALAISALLQAVALREEAAPRASAGAERIPEAGWADRTAGELLQPGPLAAAHAELAALTGCVRCHGVAQGVADARCLECHDEIATRARRQLPLHGTFEGECASCHREHAGATAALIDFDRRSFQHDRARFPLEGAHRGVECERCHEQTLETGERRFRYQGVPMAQCTSCHRDPHRSGRADTTLRDAALAAAPAPAAAAQSPLADRACDGCHTPASFATEALEPHAFQHDRDTRFALVGLHRSVACDACHTAERRELEAREHAAPGSAADAGCGSCHRDPHRGALGRSADCKRCHDPQGWKRAFDHAARTRFPLDPLHASAACRECHSDQRFTAQGRTCDACHAEAAGLLAGRFGAERGDPDPHAEAVRCADCHGETRASNLPAALGATCGRCHDARYADLLVTWRGTLERDAASVRADPEWVARLRRSGVHNFLLARRLLRERATATRR